VVPVLTVRHSNALMTVTRELMLRVICPVLVFQSRDDHVVVPSSSLYILEQVGAWDKRLV
jgi:carboxylesterase